ncbi:[Fructose-bisphosphate aldolase]-lysine N-methyltransferase, chloroplastic [Dendrobium catenatum]|uniref:[Fructose-bisphosphate aldolase]-lysine N-methyltransferase, chloroplastic n=1 Tax=Dendrobium catenatum TaxID=906689 RepID=A0A2I0WQC5_9ASPA|nr:[Fructose-bisphosphate aldolase]-lysine N-methyltransferase, chloroplastic [Dendrobium catenatum]
MVRGKKRRIRHCGVTLLGNIACKRLTDRRLRNKRLKDDEDLLRLSNARNLDFSFQLRLPSLRGELFLILEDIIQAARILYLNDVEIYFSEDDDFGPFSQRNELEAFNAVLQMLKSVLSGATPDEMKALNELQNVTIARINSIAYKNIDKMIPKKLETTAEDLLLKWGESHGARSKVMVAYFEGANRGAVALEDINVGESALEIPESIIISEDRLHESDMFEVLKAWDGMTTETMLLLWSMRERYNPLSIFKKYFETLPDSFNTGLSFGIDALTILHGTLFFEELMQAKEHLRQQYESLCPALCASYPDIFKTELYSWDRYIWACELWYSNSMKVIFSDGKLRTCLVPIAGLLNHSLFPHIIHYGRVDSETKCLKFQLARQCKRGEQCYLSYGSLSGSHLVMFYGFLPKGDNPYDIIPLGMGSSSSTATSRATKAYKGDHNPNSASRSLAVNRFKPMLGFIGEDFISSLADFASTFNDDLVVLVTYLGESVEDGVRARLERPSSWSTGLTQDYKRLLSFIFNPISESCMKKLLWLVKTNVNLRDFSLQASLLPIL